MPTDPAPEKVAALEVLAGALYEAAAGTRCGMDGPEALVLARGQRERLNAAGYDVARIEEGERLRAALDVWAIWNAHPSAHESPAELAERVRDTIIGSLRAALAASDEAARP